MVKTRFSAGPKYCFGALAVILIATLFRLFAFTPHSLPTASGYPLLSGLGTVLFAYLSYSMEIFI